jgi:metal-sulfur cluster biosynthetic enzyme
MSHDQETAQPQEVRPPLTDADVALPPPDTTIGDVQRRDAEPPDARPQDARPDDAADVPPTAAERAGVLDTSEQETGPEHLDTAPRGGGTPIEVEDDGMPSTEVMREALKAVIDPEIGYNIVDLGLLYDVEKDDEGNVEVTMTLTSMGCPLTEILHQQVSVVIGSLPGLKSVDVEFTFTPPWSPAMIADDVRLELRAMGMNV